MYHVLQLGSALTEAVTAREVCEVVSDQLLPAFGGQQLAIYVVRDGTMHLLFHTGHHEDFLDWLEGVPLHARLPGTETLTSGAPLSPPLLRRPDATTNALELDVGPLLGVDHASAYPATRIDLPPGSVLALYTDGLVEEPGADIEVGIDRLRASLAHTPADSLDEPANRLLRNARGSSHRADDIALLLTEYGSGHGAEVTPDHGVVLADSASRSGDRGPTAPTHVTSSVAGRWH
ncbi:PP2C family protein-serine/threonine phosphatase [Streptomyces sp. NPDC048304]|uniref:PP2C family protein-serine/threonine phosphatase n=1 Tax=Streptomyces sp. NPDC048304 TaxID=3154820 RepID=UPI0034111561